MKPTHRAKRAALSASVLFVASCASGPALPPIASYGPDPRLPAPRNTLVPTVDIAPAVGWPSGRTPVAAAGFAVARFAATLDHPRWLYVLPNGDVLVAESNRQPDTGQKGIKGFFMKLVMKEAGAGVLSADRITLLRDADGDGVVETRSVFLRNLRSPFGMALVGDRLYVANTDAVIRFRYRPGQTRIEARGEKVLDLPAGEINYHWTRNLAASPDGSKLYVSVGSNSNVGENGLENEVRRAAILEFEPATGRSRVFASGLRNPFGMDWHPATGALWAVVNERDEIGNDLVPDYMTAVRDGGFYGWPYSYWGSHLDARVKPQRLDLVARAIIPDYALGAHTASMGLAFYRGTTFPARYAGGAFIAQHGSWNRKPPVGYRVVFLPFRDGIPTGAPEEVLTGFLDERERAQGRPIGMAVDRTGALLVADDVGNTVWRVTPG